jgi:hypothetical protein
MSLQRIVLSGLAAYLSLVLLSLILLPDLMHRKQFDRALLSWQRNHTSENAAALRDQQQKNRVIQLETAAVEAFGLWFVGLACFATARHLLRAKNRRYRQTATRITSK